MVRIIYFSKDELLRTDLTVDEIKGALEDAKGCLWVDLMANPPEQDEEILLNIFNFHPLAVDDALQESHVPKLDDWGKFLYIVLHAVSSNKESPDLIDTLELDIFLGVNFMVTHHDQPIQAVDHLWKIIQRDLRHFKGGVDNLLYRLTDELTASYMPVVDDLDNQIDLAEDKIFDHQDSKLLEEIFSYKRSVLHLRRVINPMREVLNKLARDDYEVIDARARVYFRDVYDHLVRLNDLTENIRDLVSGTLDIYLSDLNNRMNDIMKTLTAITTLFMPMTFLTGFFGMNFFAPGIRLTPWTSVSAFIFLLLVMFGLPAIMFWWIRRRGWM